MPYIDSLPWDSEHEMCVDDDSCQHLYAYLIYVKQQCTLPVWVTVYAPTVGNAVSLARNKLGRLARGSEFAQVVLRFDDVTGRLYRVLDTRDGVSDSYIV